jgi:hypothetical protein
VVQVVSTVIIEVRTSGPLVKVVVGMVVIAVVGTDVWGLGGRLPGEGSDGGGVAAGKMMSSIRLRMKIKRFT